jgi:hypothetical protein
MQAVVAVVRISRIHLWAVVEQAVVLRVEQALAILHRQTWVVAAVVVVTQAAIMAVETAVQA